jgi:hypothetical protein
MRDSWHRSPGAALAAFVLVLAFSAPAAAAARAVLGELFTAAGSAYCPSAVAGFRDLVSAHGYEEFVPICWYGSSPYNIPEVATRRAIYGGTEAPDAWFDGTMERLGGIASGSMFSYYEPMVNARLAVSSKLNMAAGWSLESATAGVLYVNIEVEGPVTTTSNLVHFVIVEEGLTTYGITPGLARGMLADESFTLTAPGESVIYAKPFTLDPSWNVDNISFVVFVQSHSTTTKQVLQAVRAQPCEPMEVTPADGFVAAGPEGGPFTPASATYLVQNPSSMPIEYSVTTDADWLDVLSGSGTLAAHSSAEITVEVNSLAQAYGVGLQRGMITFTNLTNALGSTTRSASLEVGDRVRIFYYPLDFPPGWSHTGLWAWGQPIGGGGQNGYSDPTGGYTGDFVYGYNLYGDYENNLAEMPLTMSRVVFTNYTGVQLRFWRWLGVGDPSGDHAYIRVSRDGTNWTTFWTNTEEITDSGWVQQFVDISSLADGNGVYIRFVMGATDASGQYCGWNIDDISLWGFLPTQSSVPDGEAMTRLRLLPSSPNPFRDMATISFELPARGFVRIAVYDVSGRLVREIWGGEADAGLHTTHWDATDLAGTPVASGVYFCSVEAGGVTDTQRLVVLR